MSHGVHAVQHEVEHKIQHDEHGHGGGGHVDVNLSLNKRVALLIAVIALFLAFSETLGKSAQTNALNYQIEASNLWNFFQAKNIRRTSTIVATEQMRVDALGATSDAQKAAMSKQIDEWAKTAARYRSEPEAAGGKGEGTVELARRALEEQKKRDDALAKYHHYEVASAAFQIGIVLASATVITGMVALAYLAVGSGPGRHRLHGDRTCHARTPFICSSCLRFAAAHSLTDTLQQPHRSPGALRREHAQPLPDLFLVRIGQRVRPFQPHQHVLVEPAEPGELQQLRPRQLEDEGGDAHAHHLGERERRHGAEPEAARQQPQAEEFQRQQQDHRHQEHEQRRDAGQVPDRRLVRALNRRQGMSATNQPTIGLRRSHSHASNRKTSASRIQSGRSRRRMA